MLRTLCGSCLVFILSGIAQAEMGISSTDLNAGQTRSASASIDITVHIPVSATLQFNADFTEIKGETNMPNQGAILSCNNQQGLPVARCSDYQAGQVLTLTTL